MTPEMTQTVDRYIQRIRPLSAATILGHFSISLFDENILHLYD
jgi:hypothetical protein